MVDIKYSSDGIIVVVGEILKFNNNQPYKVQITKHVSGDIQWETDLYDNWYAHYPNTEMFDTKIIDYRGNPVYIKRWDLFENGNQFYKSLWLYNQNLISNGKFPKGLVIGTHDGEFGEWVPLVLNRKCYTVLVEASDKQYGKLRRNYLSNSTIKPLKSLVTPNGGEVEFFEGGEGYTNSVVERVIKHWEKEEVTSSKKESISITDLIINECGGQIDWLHLDVEGLDAKLIMGIDEKLVNLPNYIIFEDFNLLPNDKEEIYNWLKVRGYMINSEGGISDAIRIQ